MGIWKNILNATFWTNVDTNDLATFDARFNIGLTRILAAAREVFRVNVQAFLHNTVTKKHR